MDLSKYICKDLENMVHGYTHTYPEACEDCSDVSLLKYLKLIAVREMCIGTVGERRFLVDGVLHSEDDKPAIIWRNGSLSWYRNGIPHRATIDEDGLVLPCQINMDRGEKSWYRNGVPHRTCKDKFGNVLPAIIHSYCELWYVDGIIHRSCIDKNGKRLPAYITIGNNIRNGYCYDNGDRIGIYKE